MMIIHDRVLRGIAASFTSIIGSVLSWILLGALLPMWFMQRIVGAEALHSSPGHGAAILFVTMPLGGMLALLVLVGMTVVIYNKLTPR